MKNNNDHAMESYFNSMLDDKITEDRSAKILVDDVREPLDDLYPVTPVLTDEIVFPKQQEIAVCQQELAVEESQSQSDWKNLDVENEFQVLFFEVSAMNFAVPLIDLGGIHHLNSSLNFLIGKPDWFSGVMSQGESLYNIVDTAQWIGTGQNAETLNYSHYILLGNTGWGLSCEKLLGTETLKTEQIKWRKESGKRPWLAGMVKERMCALIHAEELVKLLNSGVNIDSR